MNKNSAGVLGIERHIIIIIIIIIKNNPTYHGEQKYKQFNLLLLLLNLHESERIFFPFKIEPLCLYV